MQGCKKSSIPNGIETIGEYSFMKCKGLTNIEIPNSVKNIKLSNNLNKIGSYAFCECASLTNIIIPSSVTIIDEFAFVVSIKINKPENSIDSSRWETLEICLITWNGNQ